MTRALVAVVALLVLAGFLGVLIYEVPRFDLAAVIGATMLLVLIDLVVTLRDGRR